MGIRCVLKFSIFAQVTHRKLLSVSTMYDKVFKELINTPCWEGHFIGYGNPNADLLIVGQEVALEEGSENWKNFYLPNWHHWKESIDHNLLSFKDGWERGDKLYTFPEFFSPLFPFYKQEFKRRKTSDTYYWYQVLVDHFYDHEDSQILGRQCKIIDFFKHAFITELNEQTRKNHTIKQSVRANIQGRLDLMRVASPFWSRFKIIVFACGHYADALQKDPHLYQSIFGDAKPFFCGQLSGNYAKSWIEKIAPEIKSVLTP